MKAADAAKQIAKDYLGINSPEPQNIDSRDFQSYNVVELKAALVAAFKLGQQNHKVEPRWYCFDQFDTFGDYDTLEEAVQQMATLEKDGLTGLHMIQMTAAEFNQYCTDGKFPFSK